MTRFEQIQADMIVAMKAKDASRLAVLRNALSAIKNAQIDAQKPLTDAEIQGVVATMVKQLKDAMKDFDAGGRADLVEQNRQEIAVLEQYLPAQMSDDELLGIVEQVLADTGAKTPADIGRVMGSAMAAVAGKADGNRVKEMVMARLTRGTA